MQNTAQITPKIQIVDMSSGANEVMEFYWDGMSFGSEAPATGVEVTKYVVAKDLTAQELDEIMIDVINGDLVH